MTQNVDLLPRWVNPREAVLRGEIFARGRPPFLPFPTVTNVCNAAHCTLAIFHDLLHGIDHALTHPYYERDYADLFERFIAILKSEIINQDFRITERTPAQIQAIQERFYEFTENTRFETDATYELWRLYVGPWVHRKIMNGELQALDANTELFYKVYLANPSTPFRLDAESSRIRSYPIRGDIMEIDIVNRRIIERTIKGRREDIVPPLMYDYKIWLLKQMITNLERNQLPEQWRDINFNTYDLIIETPYHDFNIIENNDFFQRTHSSFALISDISTSNTSRIMGYIHQNQTCTPGNPNPDCEFPFTTCFKNRYPFPISRPEIQRTFRPWYRLLLWESMWSGDLWHYQLNLLSRNDLVNLRLIEETRVINYTDNELQLEIVGRNINTFRGQDRCTIIPFGTIFCGIRIDGILTNVEGNRLYFRMENRLPPLSENALLLLSPESISPLVKSEPPTFLQRNIQRDLYNLKHIGAQNINNSLRRSVIQLLESIFGNRVLRRGRN